MKTIREKAIQHIRWLNSDSSMLGFPELGKLIEISNRCPRLYRLATQ